MISLSTTTQNESGTIILEELPSESSLDDMPARVSRTATLDGGVVITHLGFSHGDRTFKIVADVTEAEALILKTLHQTETILWISCSEGFFSGAIDSLYLNTGKITMSFLVKERLSE